MKLLQKVRKVKSKKAKSPKQKVLDRIIQKVEEGTVPWLEPNISYPKSNCFNHLKMKTEPEGYKGYFYKGIINHFLLGDLDEDFFMTFNQIRQLGASVRKGSKSEMVVFFLPVTASCIKDLVKDNIQKVDKSILRRYFTEEQLKYIGRGRMNFNNDQINTLSKLFRGIDDTTSNKLYNEANMVSMSKPNAIMRYFNVFKLSDIEGLDNVRLEQMKEHFPKLETKTIDDVEKFISSVDVEIRYGGNRRFYTPNKDYIQIPERNKFDNINRYYSTLFHELCHSTGHKSRLDRRLVSFEMDSESYSKEELIAEMGSSMLLSYFGLDIPEYNYSYINSWLEVIRGDNNLLYDSMKEVDKILKYLGVEL